MSIEELLRKLFQEMNADYNDVCVEVDDIPKHLSVMLQTRLIKIESPHLHFHVRKAGSGSDEVCIMLNKRGGVYVQVDKEQFDYTYDEFVTLLRKQIAIDKFRKEGIK